MKTFACLALAAMLLGVSPASNIVTVTVNGQASISHAADTAVLDTAIMTMDEVAEKATSENNNRYNDLRNRLRAIGIQDGAIHTTSYNVNHAPNQPMDSRSAMPARPYPYPIEQLGYVVRRTLQITLSDLSLVGPAVDAAIASKIGDVYNIQFSVSSYRELYAQALGAAMQDAQRQAAALAKASKMHIVRISQIQSGGFYPRPMIMKAAPSRQAGMPQIATEIPAGPLEVSAQVTVTYILAP